MASSIGFEREENTARSKKRRPASPKGIQICIQNYTKGKTWKFRGKVYPEVIFFVFSDASDLFFGFNILGHHFKKDD